MNSRFGDRPPKSGRSRPDAKPEAPVSHEWRTRSYDALQRAQRQSRWVRVVKYGLPVAAVLLIALALAWPALFSDTRTGSPRMTLREVGISSGNDVQMVNPRYAGVDARGRPFLITAKRALQDAKNEDLVHLTGVQADLTLTGDKATKGEIWLSVLAPSGLYNTDSQLLVLKEGADLYSNKGYEAHSPAVRIDLKNNVAEGDRGVEGHGPLGRFRADQYQFQEQAQRATLTGHVHVVYYKGFTR